MRFPRSSGVLLPVFSLPGSAGIGDFGPAAHRFIDFLHAAGQTIWQVLPLGCPAIGNSPYSSYSAFGGNWLYISPALLADDGLLSAEAVRKLQDDSSETNQVDYEGSGIVRDAFLRAAFESFRENRRPDLQQQFQNFCEQQQWWLHDFARFEIIAAAEDTPDWSLWKPELASRDEATLQTLDRQSEYKLEFSKFRQFLFARQWQQLKAYAAEKNVRLYGDMPIFVAYESVDVWTCRDLFHLDADGAPTIVAGVPPDYFSATGQKWGNPLYNWQRLRETRFDWWVRRIRHALDSFDILRIDHFRGIESYWEIPADAVDATTGEWKAGPRDELFHKAAEELGELPIVAEDLGLITDEVHHLRDRLGFPGMRVLQFGCESDEDPYHRPDHYPEHSFAYTGTHDNETILGWYNDRRENQSDQIVNRLIQDNGECVHHQLVAAVSRSAADTVIFPLQDLLGLDNSARMNTPGVPDGNWLWRCSTEDVADALAERLRELTNDCGRLP